MKKEFHSHKLYYAIKPFIIMTLALPVQIKLMVHIAIIAWSTSISINVHLALQRKRTDMIRFIFKECTTILNENLVYHFKKEVCFISLFHRALPVTIYNIYIYIYAHAFNKAPPKRDNVSF